MIDCSKCIHYEVCSNRFSNDGCEGACGFYLQDIRLQGEWINQDFDDLKISDYKCNQCGHYQDDITNFCPNCGADLRGDKNG